MIFYRHKLPDYISKTFLELEKYPDDWLPSFVIAYQALRHGQRHDIVKLSQIAHHYLRNMSISKIIKLGEQFGSYTSLLWSIDWKDVGIESSYFINQDEYESLLMIGSFHPSGNFREKCIKSFISSPHQLSLLILRMNDWVVNIQDIAYHLTCQKLKQSSLDELIEASYVLMKVRDSQRRSQIQWNDIEELYKERLQDVIVDFDKNVFLKQDIQIRKAFYRIVIEERVLSYPILEQLMKEEKDTFCLLLLIRKMLQSIDDPKYIQCFFSHRSFYIRKEAYMRYYEIVQNAWEGIEYALLDKSYSIRDYIRFVIRKHKKFDILDFYLNHLDCPEALYGVGECGNVNQMNILLPYLEYDDARIVKAALFSLSRFVTYQGADIYWRFLLDHRVSVSKTAYLLIRKNKVHYGADYIYQHYEHCQVEHIKRYLLCMLLEEDSWERLPYLLKLYWYPEIKMQQRIQRKVNQRNPYKKVSCELKEKIMNCLDNQSYAIDERTIKSIRFDLRFVCKE